MRHAHPESDRLNAAPLSAPIQWRENLRAILTICEREMLSFGAFKRFAERYRPHTLLDLRQSQSLRFVQHAGRDAFSVFAEHEIRYINIAGRVGRFADDDAYWTSDALRNTLADWMAKACLDAGSIACLFGNKEQLRRCRPIFLRAIEQSLGKDACHRVSRYRSGLLAI